MNVGVFQSQLGENDGEPSPFTAMGSATNLALGFLLLVFFWHLIIFTTWTNSWPISSAFTIFTCCNFECMSCYIKGCLGFFGHHPHIPPIQSSSKYIRRIIPKSWFCSTSLWLRQYVQVPNIPWYAFCVLGRIFTWQMFSLHAHFMPHLQNCFLSVFVFILKKHLFQGKPFRKFPFF